MKLPSIEVIFEADLTIQDFILDAFTYEEYELGLESDNNYDIILDAEGAQEYDLDIDESESLNYILDFDVVIVN